VISGVFSSANRSSSGNCRMEIRHTSATDYGQIKCRANTLMLIGVIAIVLITRIRMRLPRPWHGGHRNHGVNDLLHSSRQRQWHSLPGLRSPSAFILTDYPSSARFR
jgi:hypothetical protein